MLELTDDEGWDEEIVDTHSKGYKALKSTLIDNGLVQYYKSNTYVYLSSMNKWSVLISADTQRQLCDITGGENASVSYLAASLPYIGYMEKHAKRAGFVPASICIGTRRLRISITDGEMQLAESGNVVSVNENIDERVSSFCFMPCSFNKIPRSWSPGGAEKILKYIRVLFTDQIELKTVQWIIGVIAVDPSSVNKFLLLYGPGGTGKSTLIGMLEDIFNGCCGTISSNVLTSKNSTITLDTARTIASNRLVTAGDIDLESNQLNLHVVKEITGHDSVSVPPVKVRTRCTLVAASNDLPHPNKQKAWCSAATSRRVILVPMSVKTSLIPNVERPDSDDDSIDFLLSSVNLYLDHINSPPMSIRSMMFGLLGAGYFDIQEKIIFDDDATMQDIFDANTAIDIFFSLPLHTIGELAHLMCPNLVTENSSLYFIDNIRLLEPLNDS